MFQMGFKGVSKKSPVPVNPLKNQHLNQKADKFIEYQKKIKNYSQKSIETEVILLTVICVI